MIGVWGFDSVGYHLKRGFGKSRVHHYCAKLYNNLPQSIIMTQPLAKLERRITTKHQLDQQLGAGLPFWNLHSLHNTPRYSFLRLRFWLIYIYTFHLQTPPVQTPLKHPAPLFNFRKCLISQHPRACRNTQDSATACRHRKHNQECKWMQSDICNISEPVLCPVGFSLVCERVLVGPLSTFKFAFVEIRCPMLACEPVYCKSNSLKTYPATMQTRWSHFHHVDGDSHQSLPSNPPSLQHCAIHDGHLACWDVFTATHIFCAIAHQWHYLLKVPYEQRVRETLTTNKCMWMICKLSWQPAPTGRSCHILCQSMYN